MSTGIHCILRSIYSNPELSPNRIKGKSKEEYIRKWLEKYKHGYDTRSSIRVSNPPGTIPDPILDTIIRTRLPLLTEKNLNSVCFAHRLSMSAENILGLLLEEYIANGLKLFRWHCCWGETMRSVDFCKEDGELLQIKNRSNSENSSSSKVRDGTSIKKWYRVNANNGSYQWHDLNEKIGSDIFSEKNFEEFIKSVIQQNPSALAVESDNPWRS